MHLRQEEMTKGIWNDGGELQGQWLGMQKNVIEYC
jgi:hypothetical protein